MLISPRIGHPSCDHAIKHLSDQSKRIHLIASDGADQLLLVAAIASRPSRGVDCPPAPAFSIAAKRGTAPPPISLATECGGRSVSTCCPRTFFLAIVPVSTSTAVINGPTIRHLMRAIFQWCGRARGTAQNGSKRIAKAAYVTLREGNLVQTHTGQAREWSRAKNAKLLGVEKKDAKRK
jgi:hypothetical protein